MDNYVQTRLAEIAAAQAAKRPTAPSHRMHRPVKNIGRLIPAYPGYIVKRIS